MTYIYVSDYSTSLNLIPKPPLGLYIRGDAEVLNSPHPCVCIIGSRKHTIYGDQVVKSIVETLAPYHIPIVSGLATGIDTLAHTYALAHKLPCIAVLGCGTDDDTIYPRENLSLAHRIIEAGGLIVSEYPPETKPEKWRFPMRNRIMAGMASVIVIVEGSEKSGTLITGKIGLEYNKDIFCVPGSIFSEVSRGPLSLIVEGATPLLRPSDILVALGIKTMEDTADSTKDEPKRYREIDTKHCTASEVQILESLAEEPLSLNEISTRLHIDIADLYVHITTLEVKKYIMQKYGKIVRI
jgi:DNA processing protein